MPACRRFEGELEGSNMTPFDSRRSFQIAIASLAMLVLSGCAVMERRGQILAFATRARGHSHARRGDHPGDPSVRQEARNQADSAGQRQYGSANAGESQAGQEISPHGHRSPASDRRPAGQNGREIRPHRSASQTGVRLRTAPRRPRDRSGGHQDGLRRHARIRRRSAPPRYGDRISRNGPKAM